MIVADPNFGPMYASRSRKVKTDRRDARALAEACQLGAYRPAHRTLDAQRAVGRLRTMPSIGPVTAAAFVAALDGDASRFQSAHQVESYLGLVPREKSSGESQRKGSITKAGNGRMRWLLVQAAVSTLRLKKPETAVLRSWGERIALRRGRKIAVVALARRIAGILYAMMRDGTIYHPNQFGAVHSQVEAA